MIVINIMILTVYQIKTSNLSLHKEKKHK